MGPAEPKPNGACRRYSGMTEKELFDRASEVSSDDGRVLVDGPDGVDVALTPEAAEETGDRLIRQAVTAAGQRHFKKVVKATRPTEPHDPGRTRGPS